MSRQSYLVTVIEKVRTTYSVVADDEDEAERMIRNREPNDSVEMVYEEYYDLDTVEEVELNE